MIAENKKDNKMRYIGQSLVKHPKPPARGEVFIIVNRCKGCGLCWTYCPQQVLEESKEYNEKGYHYPQLKKNATKDCVNCGFCTLMCPEFAIHTISREEYEKEYKNKKIE